MSVQIAKIAVENAAYSFDDAFDYAIPQTLVSAVRPGVRVLVPFGQGNKTRQGFVFALRTPQTDKKLKSIIKVLDAEPLLNNELLRLAVFLKEQTFCTLFEAAKAMLPSGIGLHFVLSYVLNRSAAYQTMSFSETEQAVIDYLCEKSVYVKSDKILKDLGLEHNHSVLEGLKARGVLLCNADTKRRVGDATVKMVRLTDLYTELRGDTKVFTKKQKEVLSFLESVGTATVKETCYFTGVTAAVITALLRKGVLTTFENEIFRRPRFEKKSSVREPICLTPQQETAYTGLCRQLYAETQQTALLFGVTGSGKTQVFLRLIDAALENTDGGVIMMVPEISLTPQMLSIFYERYGQKVAVFHSALSMGERLDEWKRVKNGEAKIALGTRSAVFAPFEKLSLIIMDEEQEHTYKSEMSPRFHARDAARFRTQQHKALLLLASATPSIESYAYAKTGRYALYTLTQRYGNAVLPEVVTVDTAKTQPDKESMLSAYLLAALQENLEKGNQSILLLNRRGYHTFAACQACGKVMTCPHCSISLTYHAKNRRLMCHYCGYSEPFTTVCRDCGEAAVAFSGCGTQRLEDSLSAALPKARILRLDTDTTVSRYSFEDALKKFTNQAYDIMVGTQMVAKGLDFPNVTLVGVISVDQMLYNDDYKSAERTFDLLTQVVGRSGRGEKNGKAIIQTAFADNEVIRLATQQDFPAFFELEMRLRKAMIYPPYCDLCAVGFTAAEARTAKAAATAFSGLLQAAHKASYADLQLILLGPIAPRVERIAGKYRCRILIKCRNSKAFRTLLSECLKTFAKQPLAKKATVTADMNPENIY